MRQWRRYFFILIILFLLIGIVSVSYTATFYLFLGFLIAYLVPKTISFFLRSSFATIIVTIIILLLLLLPVTYYNIKSPLFDRIPINQYYIIIKPKTLEMQSFLIEYNLKIDEILLKNTLKKILKSDNFNAISLKEEMSGKQQGLILKELSIFPLNLDLNRESQLNKQLNLPDDIYFSGFYFYWKDNKCLESTVKLVDFPKGSFYESREPVNFKRDSYLDKDILSWSSCDLEQGIKFAYIPPPYNNFGKLIKLFSWFHSAENYLLFFFGSGVAFTFSSKVKTFLRRINPVINVQTVAIARSQSMTGDRNINTGGGNYNERIRGDYVQGNYYAAGQPQSLAEAAADIQLLLKQLEQTYPTTTTSQQMVVAAEAINRIESNPLLKERVINAVKEGGLAAFEKAIDNPAGAFIVGAIKGWQEVEAED